MHYFEDSGLPLELQDIRIRSRGVDVRMKSAKGLFSAGHVDKATALLLEAAHIPIGVKILDLGCGYGVVGIVCALADPSATVVLSDVNPRAVRVARMNADQVGAINAHVVHSDVYTDIEDDFDIILCNPPQAAGKKVCFAMIDGAPSHLKQGGSFLVVARRNVGGASLAKRMIEAFGNCEPIMKSSGIWVYKSIKK